MEEQMTVGNLSARTKVIVFSEINATHLADDLREQGYEPMFCNSKPEYAQAIRCMRRFIVTEVRTVGSIVSPFLQRLIDFAEHRGLTIQRM